MGGDASLSESIKRSAKKQSLFTSAKIIEEDVLSEMTEDFLSDSFQKKQSVIYRQNRREDREESLQTDERTSKSFIGVAPSFYPDFCEQLEDWVGDGTKVVQIDVLLYEKGDQFKMHQDRMRDRPNERIWSTTTVLHLSDDYEGLGLRIFNHRDERTFFEDVRNERVDWHYPRQEVGDTVLFKSNLFHEATPVINGKRLIIVAWLGIPSNLGQKII